MAARSPGDLALRVSLDIAGSGRAEVVTGLPALDEILALLARTAGFDLALESRADGGEAEVREVGLALGDTLRDALAPPGAAGIGDAAAPADEALAHVTVEASGRPRLVTNVDLTEAHLGGLRSDLLTALLEAIAEGAGLTIHVRLLHGVEPKHVLDAIVKALGRALAAASAPRPGGALSS